MNKLTVQEENALAEKMETIGQFRESIMTFEDQLMNLPGSYGDPKNPGQDKKANEINPLKHTFAGGCYIRELFMPKSQLITTGIHKKEHCFFVTKGDVSVLTEEGIHRITAPYSGITQPGTKRIIYVHEDTIWTTVHRTDKDNVKDVLEEIIAKDFSDPSVCLEAVKEKLIKNK